jgi:hypothetical protein
MCPFPCLHVHVSISMSPCQCLPSMSPCQCLPSMSPCLHFSMYPCLMSCLHVSMSVSPCLYASMSMSPCFEFHKRKTELTENRTDGKRQLHLSAANKKTEGANFRLFLQMETENRSLFSLVCKWEMVIDDCCFSKRAHLCI